MINFSEAELARYENQAKEVWEWWADQTPGNRKVFDAAVKLLEEMRSGSAS